MLGDAGKLTHECRMSIFLYINSNRSKEAYFNIGQKK